MRLLFLRHGDTDYTQLSLFCGCSNPPLNKEGQNIARNVAAEFCTAGFSFPRIYTSPLARCMETAQLINPNAELISINEFREMNFGVFEGMNHITAQNVDPKGYQRWISDWQRNGPPGGESFRQVLERAKKGLQKLVLEDREEKPLLVVSHAGLLAAVYALICGCPRDYLHLHPGEWFLAGF